MSSQPVGTPEYSRVLTPESPVRKMATALPVPETAWTVLGWFGIAALLIGGLDILLAWYPLQGGNPAWEFGIVNLTIWSLPFPTTGLVLLLASGLALETRWRIRLAGAIMLTLAAIVLAALVLYALTIPIALQGAPAQVHLNVKKSIVKTVVLGLTFSALYVTLAVSALRRRRKS